MKLTSVLRVPSLSKYVTFLPYLKSQNDFHRNYSQKLKRNNNSSAMACYRIFVCCLRAGNILKKYGAGVSSSPPSAFQEVFLDLLQWFLELKDVSGSTWLSLGTDLRSLWGDTLMGSPLAQPSSNKMSSRTLTKKPSGPQRHQTLVILSM